MSIQSIPNEVLALVFQQFCFHCQEQDVQLESAATFPLDPDHAFRPMPRLEDKDDDYCTHPSIGARQTLLSLCIVSKSFRAMAQPILYHDFMPGWHSGWTPACFKYFRDDPTFKPPINTEGILKSFVGTITKRLDLALSVRRVMLHQYVLDGLRDFQSEVKDVLAMAEESLHLSPRQMKTIWPRRSQPDGPYWSHPEQDIRRQMANSAYTFLFAILPNVETLYIHPSRTGLGGIPDPKCLAAGFGVYQLPRLRRLCLAAWTSQSYFMLYPRLAEFLTMAPSLRELACYKVSEASWGKRRPNKISPGWPKTMPLQGVDSNTASGQRVRSPLPPSLRTLRLTLSKLSTETTVSLLSSCAPDTLEHFSLVASFSSEPNFHNRGPCGSGYMAVIGDLCNTPPSSIYLSPREIVRALGSQKDTLRAFYIDLRELHFYAPSQPQLNAVQSMPTLKHFSKLTYLRVNVTAFCNPSHHPAPESGKHLITQVLPGSIVELEILHCDGDEAPFIQLDQEFILSIFPPALAGLAEALILGKRQNEVACDGVEGAEGDRGRAAGICPEEHASLGSQVLEEGARGGKFPYLHRVTCHGRPGNIEDYEEVEGMFRRARVAFNWAVFNKEEPPILCGPKELRVPRTRGPEAEELVYCDSYSGSDGDTDDL